MSRLTATLLLLIAALIWGFTFVVQKWAASAAVTMQAMSFTGLRFALGALVITPWMLREKRQHGALATQHQWGFIVCGALLFLASWTQQRGIEQTSVSNAGFFTGIYVVLTPFISWLGFQLKPHKWVWPAVLLTLLGIWLLNGGSLTRFGSGDLWVLACSVFWALQITLVGVLAARTGRPLTLAWMQFLTTGLIGCVLALCSSPTDFVVAPLIWRELLWASVMSVGVAFTLQVVAQRHLPPAVAAIIMGSEMLFAALSGALFLGERLTYTQLLGGVLMFGAIVLVEVLPQLSRPPHASAANR